MKLTENDVVEAVKLYQDGHTLKQVATRFGVTAPTIRLALLKASVPMRKKGPIASDVRAQLGAYRTVPSTESN